MILTARIKRWRMVCVAAWALLALGMLPMAGRGMAQRR